jgi:hypothetical protein
MLHVKDSDPVRLKNRLTDNGIILPPPVGQTFSMKINVTLNRDTPENIARKFKLAIS